MSQEQQLDRLRRLRAARGEAATRLEAVRGDLPPGSQGNWAAAGPPPPSRGHGGALIGLLVLVAVAALALGGVAYVSSKFHSTAGGPRRTVQFTVRSGDSISTIADELQNDKLVSNSFLFKIYFQYFKGGSGTVQVGMHALNTDMSMDKIAKALETPVPVVIPTRSTANQYNILAGKRAEEIATILDKYHIATYADVMQEVTHGKFDNWFLKGLPPGTSLEGFLAPGEYTLLPHMGAHAAIALMLNRFGQEFTPAMAAQAKQAHHSILDIVTIASIVQRESSLPKVQKAIAGVLYNRLQNSDVVSNELGADPTVQYALGYDQAQKTWWRSGLTQDDYKSVQSPYNTYIHPGLPPGPISSPGMGALDAALNPTKSNWLFYQSSGKDNARQTTYFCATYQCQIDGDGVAVK